MPTAFNLMTRLKNGLTLRDMSTDVFGAVATLEGIKHGSKAQLNKAFSDRFVMPGESAQKLWDLWCELEALIDCLLPYRIDLSTAERVHSQLLLFRAATMAGALQFLGINNGGSSDTGPADNNLAHG